jgi:hypothetical protein
MPEKHPGEYARALQVLAAADTGPDVEAYRALLTNLVADRETAFAMLGLAEDLLQLLHQGLATVRHARVDDTLPTPIRAIRTKVEASAADEMLDGIVQQLRAFTILFHHGIALPSEPQRGEEP